MRIIGDTKIYHWEEIREAFRGAAIFLGNGFSININPALNYRSLFDKFLSCLSADDQQLFRKFRSTNFEEIQNKLADAVEVNAIFGRETEPFKNALHQLKSGLLSSIKDLHPNYSSIDTTSIHTLSLKLDWFGNIFTTNYDVFLYHIVLTTLDRRRRDKAVIPFQDFFRASGTELNFTPESLAGFRNIYYLHGALFIFNDGGVTSKIRRGENTEELLDIVRLRIHTGQIPLFVSEGKSEQKKVAIALSQYLSFCSHAFSQSKSRTLIYGLSFSEADRHLLEMLNTNRRRLAIGLYTPDLNGDQILQKIKGIERKLYKYRKGEIKYFDSRTLF